jgi:hypothetical protein
VSNDVGDVCADASEGRITFTGRGLAPGSEIMVTGPAPDDQSVFLEVGVDGTSATPDASGVLFAFTGTDVTFRVAATDDLGERFEGEIVLST